MEGIDSDSISQIKDVTNDSPENYILSFLNKKQLESKEEYKKEPSIINTNRSTLKTKKDKVKDIFWKYAEVSERNGESYLKPRQFLKLLQDSKILDNTTMTKSKANILFASIAGRKEMTFEQFFQSLVNMAEVKYEEVYKLNKKIALEELLNKHLLPLSEVFPGEEFTYNEVPVFIGQLVYDEAIKSMFSSIYSTLKDIYEGYFLIPFKAVRNQEQIEQITSKQLLVFAREFDIIKCYSMSKQIIISILNTLIDTPESTLTNNSNNPSILPYNTFKTEDNIRFTLGRFFIFLFWIAVVGYEYIKNNVPECTNSGKVYLLLSKMEVSKGFAQLFKRNYKHYTSPHTLIPEIALIPYKNSVEEAKEVSKEDSNCKQVLHKVFIEYSEIGNSNVNQITWFKFAKLLKDHNIIKPGTLSIVEAELLFKKREPFTSAKKGLVIKDEKKTKLDFISFCSAMKEIAIKQYPNLPPETALTTFCDTVILNLAHRTSIQANLNLY